jgi:protein-S-isoprenylcysteine O-methyltransferase Ste14
MKGVKKLRNKLPDYQGKKILIYIFIVFIVTISSIMFQVFTDSIAVVVFNIPFLTLLAFLLPIIGPLCVVIVGLFLVFSFWRLREKRLNQDPEVAYQRSFIFVVTGIPMVLSVMIHSFFPQNLILSYSNSEILSYLADPFLSIGSPFIIIRFTAGIIFFFMGITLILKSLKIFGIDNMGLVYVYYPNESTLKNHEIYSILRHPTYHSIMLIFIGSILVRFSIYSIIYFLMFIIGINIHLKFVEEKELIERFGEEYTKYREDVPAFIVRFKDLKRYMKFIIRG